MQKSSKTPKPNGIPRPPSFKAALGGQFCVGQLLSIFFLLNLTWATIKSTSYVVTKNLEIAVISAKKYIFFAPATGLRPEISGKCVGQLLSLFYSLNLLIGQLFRGVSVWISPVPF